jgi:hypothetical protein
MISNLDKAQWISVVKNAVIAGVAAFAVSLQLSGDINNQTLVVAAVAGATAAIKFVEKLFTPTE